MSKYFKPGYSRYSKRGSDDTLASVTTSTAVLEQAAKKAKDHSVSGYTDQDEQLFDSLADQLAKVRIQATSVGQEQTYETPYSLQDADLFDRLHPDSRTRHPDAHRSVTRND